MGKPIAFFSLLSLFSTTGLIQRLPQLSKKFVVILSLLFAHQGYSQQLCSTDLTSFDLGSIDQIQTCYEIERIRPRKYKKTYCLIKGSNAINSTPAEIHSCKELSPFKYASLKLHWKDHTPDSKKILENFLRMERPLYFGASMTAESLQKKSIKGYINRGLYKMITHKANIDEYLVGENPAKLAVKKVYEAYSQINPRFKTSPQHEDYSGENISPFMKTNEENIGRMQVLSMLHDQIVVPKQEDARELYKKATSIIGFDGFYWDAAINFENCGYGDPQYGLTEYPKIRTDIEGVIQSLIETTKRDGKFLFLATVSLDTVQSSKIDNFDLGFRGYHENGLGGYDTAKSKPHRQVWRPGIGSCVESINDTIRSFCGQSDLCEYLDLHKINKAIWNQQYDQVDQVPAEFADWRFYDFRPDGVHLSELASEILSNIIFNQFIK